MTADLAVSGREALADWLETTLLVRHGAPLGVDAVQRLSSEEAAATPAQAQLAMNIMRRRADILGESYPFELFEWAVRARPGAATTPYAALLLLTPDSPSRQLLNRKPTAEMAVLFERITEKAVARLWGGNGRALRFGWPSDAGRPPEFYGAIEWLALNMGLAVGAGYRPPRRKDGGVDVVGWRPFPDARSGFPIVLVQCTLQSDILAKATDVDARLWATWLVLDDEPQTALAVPQTIQSGTDWDQLALHGAIFERLRIAGLLADTDRVLGLDEWTPPVIDALQPLLAGGEF